MLSFLKNKQSRLDYLRNQLGAFAHENRDVLLIVADPETDYVMVSYKDKMVLGKLKSLEGADLGIVKGVVRQSKLKSKFDEAIDKFLGGLVDTLQLGLKEGNQFYSYLSDVLFAFQEKSKHWKAKQKKVEEVLQNKPVA